MSRSRWVTQLGIYVGFVGCVLWAGVDERLERLEQKTLSQSPGAEQETGNMVFFRGG